ncbi:MAG: hypothetical protein ACOCU4_10945 [Alkalispirochaeta sp.]
MAFRGIRLERRRGRGVRLLDDLPGDMLAKASVEGGASHEAADRPMLVLLYLIANPGWCKISELAHVFFLSDSSVSTALAHVEDVIPASVGLERHKGVGVRITGDELTLRLGFIGVFSRLFPLYVSDREDNGHRLLRSLRLGDAAHLILSGISAAEGILSYRLAPGYAGMLFSYIYLLRRRIPEGQMLRTGPSRAGPQHVPSRGDGLMRAAREIENLALRDGIAGVLPPVEQALLADVIGACEPVDSPIAMTANVLGGLEQPVDQVIERLLARIEEKEHVWLHDDSSLLNYLRLTLAAVTRRIHLFRQWDAIWLPSIPTAQECGENPVSLLLLQEYLRVFPSLFTAWPHGFGALEDVLCRQLREPYLAVEARLSSIHRRRSAGLSIKILCYEGLGMSAWLGALVKGILPSGATVDTRWETQVADNRWDLVIATYDVNIDGVPSIVIDADDTPEGIRKDVEDAVRQILPAAAGADVRRNSAGEALSGEVELRSDTRNSRLSLSVVMSVVRTFFLEAIEPGVEVIDAAVDALDRGDCDRQLLRADLLRRESYGSLVFDDLGVRLVHCRSNGIPDPRAGVLRSEAHGVVLVLAAPRTAPPEQTAVLSEIVVALTEDDVLSRALTDGTVEEIRAGLTELFSRLLS